MFSPLYSSANVKQKMDRLNSAKVGTGKSFGQNMTGQKQKGKGRAFGQKKKKKSNKNR